jgi:hypothetical protein
MTGPPGKQFQAAPPTKRANPNGIPVRLHDGTLVAHAGPELEQRLLTEGRPSRSDMGNDVIFAFDRVSTFPER